MRGRWFHLQSRYDYYLEEDVHDDDDDENGPIVNDDSDGPELMFLMIADGLG